MVCHRDESLLSLLSLLYFFTCYNLIIMLVLTSKSQCEVLVKLETRGSLAKKKDNVFA